MKRLIPLIILSLAGLGGFSWWQEVRFITETDNAYLQSDIINVASELSGSVIELKIQDNQTVKQGELLLTLDTRELEAKKEEAQAGIAAKKASLENLKARISLQEILIRQSEVALPGSEAEVRRSRQELDRAQALIRDEVVSKQKHDTNQADAVKAVAALNQLKVQIEAAKGQINVLQTEQHMAEAALQQAEAALKAIEIALSKSQIIAPQDGIIANRSVQQGQFIRAGQPLLSLVRSNPIWIEANFKETQIHNLKLGQKVKIGIDSFPGHHFAGEITSFAPASGAKFSLLPPENATGNFTKVVQRIPVRISLKNPDNLPLKPGMSAIVKIDIRQ